MMPTRVKAKRRKQTQARGKSGGHAATQRLTPQPPRALPHPSTSAPGHQELWFSAGGKTKGKVMPPEFS